MFLVPNINVIAHSQYLCTSHRLLTVNHLDLPRTKSVAGTYNNYKI